MHSSVSDVDVEMHFYANSLIASKLSYPTIRPPLYLQITSNIFYLRIEHIAHVVVIPIINNKPASGLQKVELFFALLQGFNEGPINKYLYLIHTYTDTPTKQTNHRKS